MVVATLRPQDDRAGNSDDPTRHASEKKKPEEDEKVSMCMHVCAFACICMLAAVLMVTDMQRDKPLSPPVPPRDDNEEE